MKDQIFGHFERIGKALASRRRLQLLDVLAQGERSVEDLGTETGTSVANASQHLQVLSGARLVETRREGTRVFYRLADERVFELFQAVREVAQSRLAEIEQIASAYRQDRGDLEPVRMQDLLDRMQKDEVVVLDVRPSPEYDSGHIPGARSIPIDELEERLTEIPDDVEVVAYCRGPYCVFAHDAVEALRRHGRAARRLEAGYPDWRAAGLPTDAIRSSSEPQNAVSPKTDPPSHASR